jgi:hypothetical protein
VLNLGCLTWDAKKGEVKQESKSILSLFSSAKPVENETTKQQEALQAIEKVVKE